MAFIDIEGGAYRPAGTKPKGSGAGAPMSGPVPQKASAVQQPVPQKASVAQAERDDRMQWFDDGSGGYYRDPANGNIWKGGVWYNPQGQVWTEGRGWESPESYNTFIDQLNRQNTADANYFGFNDSQYQAGVTTPRISPQDFTNIQRARELLDSQTYNLRGPGFSAAEITGTASTMYRPEVMAAKLEHDALAPQFWDISEAQRSIPGVTPQEAKQLSDTDLYAQAGQAARFQNRWGDVNTGKSSLSELLGPIATGYKKANTVLDAFAETGAQLTPAALTATKAIPGLGAIVNTGANLIGYRPQDSALSGVRDLGESIAQSSDPWDFARTQQNKLQERPLGEQLASQVIFDPTNLIGAGMVTKGLRGAQGTGRFSDLMRGLGTVNDAIDRGTQAAFGTALKPLGALARPLSSEAGTIPAGLAARAGAGAALGAAGYATADDDASRQDKFLRALGFGAGGALGADVIRYGTRGAAEAYGKAITPLANSPIPLFSKSGAWRDAWIDALPESERLAGETVNPLIYLKNVDSSRPLPLSTKISNKFWEVLSKASRDDLVGRVVDERVYDIALVTRTAQDAIPGAVDNALAAVGTDYKAAFQFSDEGYVLRPDGTPIQVLDEAGNPVFLKENQPVYAGPADVEENWKNHLMRGDITPEQARITAERMRLAEDVKSLRLAFGLPMDESKFIGPDGYVPRGTATHSRADTTPTIRKGGNVMEGQRPGSSRERQIRYQGEHIAQGWRYPDPMDALRDLMIQSYEEVNIANMRDNLGKLAVEVELLDGEKRLVELSEILRDPAVRNSLKEQTAAVRETRAELRKLKIRQGRIDRDIRLGSKWVGTNRKRAERLTALATDQTISASARAEAAHDAVQLSKVAIDDALAAAKTYAKRTMVAGIQESEARRTLRDVLDQAEVLSKQIDAAEDQIKAGDLADLQQKVAGAWGYAEAIRAAVADDIANADRLLAALPYEDTNAANIAARKALQDARGQFSESLSELNRLQKQAQLMASREATAAANVRAMVNQGKVDELRRLIEKKAAEMSRLGEQSQELTERIAYLNDTLLAQRDLQKTLKADIQATSELGKEFKALFPTGRMKGIAGMDDLHLPPEIATTIKKYVVSDRGRGAGGAVFDLVNDLFRFLGATLDASRSATVGILGLADNPAMAAKGFKGGAKSGFKPEEAWHILKDIENEAVEEGMPSLAEAFGRYKLQIASAEHLRLGMADEGTALESLSRKPGFRHADALYSTPGNIERALHFYDELRVLRARGRDWTSDSARAAAANAANVLTGRASQGLMSGILGDTGSRRLFFAGRFVQSTLESVYNAMLVSGVEGDVARRSMLRVAAGGAAITFAINELLGNETDWRPIVDGRVNPNFMRIRIGGHDISVFGPWDSLVKGVLITASGDPGYFLRTKFAPVAGMLYDASINSWKTGFGTDMASPAGLWELAPLPFGVKDIAERVPETDFSEAESIGSLAMGVGASMTGLKASPLTPREKYDEILREKHKDYAPTRPDGSPLDYPMPSNPYDDPLFTLEYGKAHPNDVPKPVSDLGKEMAAIREEYDKRFNTITSDFESGKLTLGEWKDQRSQLKAEEAALLKPLIEQIDFSDPKEGTPGWWLQKYYETFKVSTDPDTGMLDRGKLDYEQSEFLREAQEAQVDGWLFDYIDKLTANRAANPIEMEYLHAVQQLARDGYFTGRENSKPRYIGLTMADEDVFAANRIVDGKSKDPKYAGLERADRVFLILRDEGYSVQQIKDVINSTKEAFEHPSFTLYKRRNPQLVEWLNEDNFYSTLQAITANN